VLTWRDEVSALSLDALPKRFTVEARVAVVEQNGDLYLASLFERDLPQASWTFGPENLDNTKARILRWLGVYE